jgi:transposase
MAYKANRPGVAERLPAPAVQQSIAVALALLDHYDHRWMAWELDIVRTAQHHAANTFYRLQAVPGVGNIRALVMRYARPEIARWPRVQACVSYCRLVKCAKESAGKRYGTSGTTSGNADLTWAFSEAAVLFLRQNAPGQKYLARRENNHGTGKALTLLAPTRARAVYSRRTRAPAFARDNFRHG